jgi:hypothetical protein
MPDSDGPAEGESPPKPDLLRVRYDRRVGHLANIDPVRMRSNAVVETLLDRNPGEALYWLDQMVRGSVWGRQDDLDTALGLIFWLVQNPRGGSAYEFFGEIYRIAHDNRVENVLYLLKNPPPHQTMGEEADLPDVRLPIDRDDISVGERRMMARKADSEMIDRLVFDPEPLVIENLLENPDLTLRQVLKIASRRPTKPNLLERLVAHHGWFGRQRLRKALVMNPYNDTGLSLKLLPTVGIEALRRVRYGSDVHEILGGFAAHLVDMRETHTSPWEV